jgi:3-hydroxybutyrate dehydrogenase
LDFFLSDNVNATKFKRNQTEPSKMKGKTALITGSAAGLGFAMAEELARAGCHVVLHGIESPESVQPQQARLAREHGVSVAYLHADLTESGAAERLVAQASAIHGGIDILVNNAVTRHFAGVSEFPVEHWDRALAVNLSAAFHTIRLSLPGMRARGWGRIFNMTSVYGARAVANRIDYVTTKTALIGLTRAVAIETINQGITCNAICPGSVLTPANEGRIEALMAETGLERRAAIERFLAGKQPIQRFVDAAHVAQLLVFLCGEAGTDITGAVLPMEGGWLAA